MPQSPELFDFPCARVWRCGYSGEPYEPEAEEVKRAERLEAGMEANGRFHNEVDPFRAALGSSGVFLAPVSYKGAWVDIVLQGGLKKGLRPLDE